MNIITTSASLINTQKRLAQSGLPASLKRKFYSTYFKTFFLRHHNKKSKTAKVNDFTVHYANFHSLTTLYIEIFVNLEYFFKAENECPFILDCGSNIGIAQLFFKTLYPRATIIGFEPDEQTFKILNRNIIENSLTHIDIHNIALMAEEGPVTFYTDTDTPGSLSMSTRKDRMAKNGYNVMADVLSRYINREVDLLKLDIEGVEFEVLREVNNAGKLCMIKQMIIEYHHHISSGEDNLSGFLTLLESNGFGYQIEGKLSRPLIKSVFQDILIYAYRK